MSYSGFSTTPDVVSASSAPVTAVPITMACWGYTSDIATAQTMIDIGNSASATNRNMFCLRTSGNNISARVGDGAGTAQAVTTASPSTNTWYHAAGVFTANNSRTVYLDGTNEVTNTTSLTPSGVNRTSIGLNYHSTSSEPFLGRLAEVGIWSVALDAAEIAALAAGMPPPLIRPQSLVVYVPLVRTLVSYTTTSFSVVGSLAVSDHCRIYGLSA